MAVSGTGSIKLESIDYTGALASGTCASASNMSGFGRGKYTQTHTFSWTIDGNQNLTVQWVGMQADSLGSTWIVCSDNGYWLETQFSEDGNTWTALGTSFLNNAQTQSCTTYTAKQMIQDLTGMLPAMKVTKPGFIRIFTYTLRACPTIGQYTESAFPTSVYSEVVTTPVPVDPIVDYRPGMVWNGSAWMSCNRTGGVCQLWNGSAWEEMRTFDGGVGKGNPPLIYRDGDWYNMASIGEE